MFTQWHGGYGCQPWGVTVGTLYYAFVDNSVILPNVGIAHSARLRNVVVDKGVRIPEKLMVGEDPSMGR
jgi:ADP-glucose pyrophosphorylase